MIKTIGTACAEICLVAASQYVHVYVSIISECRRKNPSHHLHAKEISSFLLIAYHGSAQSDISVGDGHWFDACNWWIQPTM
jgi:hypothetical protein